MNRRVLILLAALSLPPASVGACTCVAAIGENAWPTIEEAAPRADAVFVGRVLTRVVLLDPPPYEGHDVANVEVEVVDGIAGLPAGARVRVWDAGFGSSCTVDLRPLAPGTLVAMAIERNGQKYQEYQTIMRLRIAPDDYLLQHCGDYMRPLRSERDAVKVGKRLRRAIANASQGRRTTR